MKLSSLAVVGVVLFAFSLAMPVARASTEGSISGNVTDDQGVAIPNLTVSVKTPEGAVVKQVQTSAAGDYEIYPITFGDYQISVEAPGFAPYRAAVHVSSGAATQVGIQLSPAQPGGAEMVLHVEAAKRAVQTSTSTSATEVNSEQIADLPQGEDISLPHLLASMTPSVIQGPFGQTFIRGNHANVQYQIDGVQLPDSQTNTFGDAFTPRNIDHMEVITGGIPAEYGNRLAAVVNIITKTGPETPGGQAEVNYGSYNTFSPWATYGGSNEKGDLHYFFSGQFTRTDRGLDTPQPESDGGSCGLACANQNQGGTDAIHDVSNGNNEFAKIDWYPDNDNKFSLIAFNNAVYYQIPDYPSNYLYTDNFFQSGFSDAFQNSNGGVGTTPVFVWTPSTTNDTQFNDDAYAELVWKHSFSDHEFLQTAAYYKYSEVDVTNDPTNDLMGAQLIPFEVSSSFAENRHINNAGLKGDYSNRVNDRNMVKAGYQLQYSYAAGPISVAELTNTGGTLGAVTGLTPASSLDTSTASGGFESVYLQDDFQISKKLVLNAGVRFDAIQYLFAGTEQGNVTSDDNQLEPRIGLNYFIGETTKLHAYYGRLFQPAPLEDLRDTFIDTAGTQGTQLSFYDIKAEKDDFYEAGVAQQIGDQVLDVNAWGKEATDLLDDTELLNTSLAAAYNYSQGYGYGVDVSIQGKISKQWSDYANYSYEIAKGTGAAGGLFALPPGAYVCPPGSYCYLDHVQIHTANAGISFATDQVHWTTQALFGSGLRTGPNNSLSLPSHFSMDTSIGYDFAGDSWLSKVKLSLDVLNIFNNVYPITIANGFNGSHYAAGREFIVHLTKQL